MISELRCSCATLLVYAHAFGIFLRRRHDEHPGRHTCGDLQRQQALVAEA